MATLVCLKCDTAILEDEQPDDPRVTIRCPKCQGSSFVARPEWHDALSYHDKRLLKKAGISTGTAEKDKRK